MKTIVIFVFAIIFSLAFAIESENFFSEEIKGLERLPEFLPKNVSGRTYCPTDDIW